MKCSCEARGCMDVKHNVTMRDRSTIPPRDSRRREANNGQVVTRNLIQTPYINNINAKCERDATLCKCVRI